MGSYISLESLDIYNSIHIPTNDKLKLNDDKLNDDKLNDDKLNDDKLKDDKLNDDKLNDDKLKDDKNSNNTRYCYGLKIA